MAPEPTPRSAISKARPSGKAFRHTSSTASVSGRGRQHVGGDRQHDLPEALAAQDARHRLALAGGAPHSPPAAPAASDVQSDDRDRSGCRCATPRRRPPAAGGRRWTGCRCARPSGGLARPSRRSAGWGSRSWALDGLARAAGQAGTVIRLGRSPLMARLPRPDSGLLSALSRPAAAADCGAGSPPALAAWRRARQARTCCTRAATSWCAIWGSSPARGRMSQTRQIPTPEDYEAKEPGRGRLAAHPAAYPAQGLVRHLLACGGAYLGDRVGFVAGRRDLLHDAVAVSDAGGLRDHLRPVRRSDRRLGAAAVPVFGAAGQRGRVHRRPDAAAGREFDAAS